MIHNDMTVTEQSFAKLLKVHNDLLKACEAARESYKFAGMYAAAKEQGWVDKNGHFPLYDQLHRAICQATGVQP